jgi:hypothetical protein
LVLIGVAGVLFLLGLFAFPWVTGHVGSRTFSSRYPEVASGVIRSGGGSLNPWQRLYNSWFALIFAIIFIGVAIAAVAVGHRHRSKLSYLPVIAIFGMMLASFVGMPTFPPGSGPALPDFRAGPGLLSAGCVGLGYLLLMCACPVPSVGREQPGVARTQAKLDL